MFTSHINMFKLGGGIKRLISVSSVLRKEITETNKNTYTTIYKFPYIRSIHIVNRMKIYHTVATAVIVPCTYALAKLHYLPYETISLSIVTGLTGIATLYSITYFTDKLVGFVYVNEKQDKVKVAYIDYWGRRKNVEVPTNDIVPFSEQSLNLTDRMYLKIKTYSNSSSEMKINVTHGVILDQEKFNKIFK